jgi:hypothetical protein
MQITKAAELVRMIEDGARMQRATGLGEAIEDWISHYFIGIDDVEQHTNLTTASRSVEIAIQEFKETQPEGVTKIEVIQKRSGKILLTVTT